MSPASGRRDRAGVRSGLIAALSTVVVFTVIGLVVVNSPGWPKVHKSFFSGAKFRESFPAIARAFALNVRIFLIAEVGVLILGLLVALIRMVPGPAMFPFRALATIYTDVFRGVPTLLIIYLFGFGIPGLGLDRPWNNPIIWATAALVLNYGAYVAEVFRAGIRSVHPSQMAAARSLGLTQLQAMRFVVVPQAVRRVIPPLLNDFVALQKDSALIAPLGPIEALRRAQTASARGFNFTPYLAASVLFLALTIPLARCTDWLTERQERARR